MIRIPVLSAFIRIRLCSSAASRSRRIPGLLALLLQAGVLATACSASTSSPPLSECDPTLWDHVYLPSRLRVVDWCKTISGTITYVQEEWDGDLHIGLRPDPQFADLLNEVNIEQQAEALVVEPVCATRAIWPPWAVIACVNFSNRVSIPNVGDHVEIVGSYVLDTRHGWMEIHPVTRIEVR